MRARSTLAALGLAALCTLQAPAEDRGAPPAAKPASAPDGNGMVVESQGPNTRARIPQSGRSPQALTGKTLSNPYCTQPDPRQDACYLNFRYYTASDNGISAPYMLKAVVSVNSKPVFTMNLFFENNIYADHTMPGLGFRVACGPPPGNNYLFKFEPQDSLGNGMGYDQASISCPPYQP